MNNFATLYKYGGNNKKVLEWKIKIKKNEENETYDIITLYGEMNGKMIEKRINITSGKAGRTIEQQALQEATRRYKDKMEKENYKEQLIEKRESEFRPMLAQTFTFESLEKPGKQYKMVFPLYIQPKLDGIRCISHYINSNENIIMFSRKGTPFNHFIDIKEELKNLIMLSGINEEIYIDGELYSEEITFEKINGTVRAQELTEEHKETMKLIKYHIYDIYIINHPFLGYNERYEILKRIIKENDKCKLVRTELINEKEDIKRQHEKSILEGYEGIILRDTIGIYEIDKRSKYLQKYKTFLEEEFKIVGYADEDGMIIFKCITEKDKKVFSVRPRGTFESRREMFERGDEYINKYLTVIFQEYSDFGIPRFPIGKAIRDYE